MNLDIKPSCESCGLLANSTPRNKRLLRCLDVLEQIAIDSRATIAERLSAISGISQILSGKPVTMVNGVVVSDDYEIFCNGVDVSGNQVNSAFPPNGPPILCNGVPVG